METTGLEVKVTSVRPGEHVLVIVGEDGEGADLFRFSSREGAMDFLIDQATQAAVGSLGDQEKQEVSHRPYGPAETFETWASTLVEDMGQMQDALADLRESVQNLQVAAARLQNNE